MKHDPELEVLAFRIADDQPIDWSKAPPHCTDLRELDHLVRGFRHLRETASRKRENQQSVLFKFAHLEVIRKLGSGSLGDVYRAYDPVLDQHVALKLRKSGSGISTSKALQEARRLARIRQANVVSVYGAAVVEDQVGLWTELVHGKTLADLLTNEGAFDREEAASIGIDICHALAAVHRHGLVHGDVKLENVMREDGGRIVLMDFGAAREFHGTESGEMVSGTLSYLAPEVLGGELPTPCSDQYALGILLFRMLTGRYPYSVRDYDALRAEQDNNKRLRLSVLTPELPPQMVKAVERACNPDPLKRFGSVMALAAALQPPVVRTSSMWLKTSLAIVAMAIAASLFGVWYSNKEITPSVQWETQLQFYRVNSERREALVDGTVLSAGDRLALDFESTKPVYLYVIDDDGGGSAEILFPKENIKPANPLAANIGHILPGTIENHAYQWYINRESVHEEFIVIASSERQADLDRMAMSSSHLNIIANTSQEGGRGLSLVPSENSGTISAALRKILEKENLDSKSPNSFGPKLRYWHFLFPH